MGSASSPGCAPCERAVRRREKLKNKKREQKTLEPNEMQADGRAILTTDYQVRPVHFMFTNGFSVTKWFRWHLVPKKNPETVQIHANSSSGGVCTKMI